MDKFTQKWTIIIPLESIEEGMEYIYTAWPLHITLASVFAIDCDGKTLAKELEELLAQQHRFKVTAEQEDRLGPDKNVGVMKMQRSPELIALHNLIHHWLAQQKAVFNEPQYEGSGYLPHSTYQKHIRLKAGDTVSVDSVAIVDMFPDSNGHQRKIIKLVELAP